MPDRWRRFCRCLVPPMLREDVFDPAAADLEHDWAERGRPGWGARLARAAELLALALESRRVGTLARGAVMRSPGPASAGALPPESGSPLRAALSPAALARDVRFALRRLARQPMFALVAVLTLGLGTGANVTLFAFVDALLLAPIRAEAPADLVRVFPSADGDSRVVSYPNYADARDLAPAVDLAAHQQATVSVGTADALETRTVELVTGNFFRVLMLRPLLGRLIDDCDDRVELESPVAVLSEAYWRAAFGAAPDIVGHEIVLNGGRFTIIGVAPRGFRGTYNGHAVDLWVPVHMQQVARPTGLTLDRRGWGWLSMIGRLRPGETIATARAELSRAAARLADAYPGNGRDFGLTAVPASGVADRDRQALGASLGTVYAFTLLLFLVTCANLAGVMQARLASRRRDVAIRLSLGAGRGRLVREWLVECLVLATAGGAASLLVARLTAAVVGRLQPPGGVVGGFAFDVPVGARAGGYAVALAVLATMLFGALPAWRLGRATDDALREDVTTTVGGRRRARGRRLAVATQVALSAMLLVAAAWLLASVRFQLRANPGFETAHLAVATIDLRRQRVPEAAVGPLMDRAIAAARGVPGVVGADAAMRAPLDMGQDRMAFGIPGYTNPEGTDRASIDFTAVTSGYFDTLGDPFVAGGAWDATAARTRPFAVVNETLVRRYFAGVSPVGRTIELVGLGPIPVSGVVADTAYYSIDEAPLPFVFLSAESQPPTVFQLHVRTSVPPATVLGPLARGLAAADGRLAPSPVVTFEDLRRVPLFPARALAAAATAFGLLALGLTAIGLYGVATASVTQRTREIGVRLALGAQPGDVARAVMREAVGLAFGGAAVGLAGAWLAGGALGGWLVGITRTSPGPYAGVVLLVSAVTTVAAWLPARRAARVDPVETLRRA